jgi:type VI secretion system FHA domain protein
MSFTVVIQELDGTEGEKSEREFDQATVSIGRGGSSDLILKDPQRMISSRHAEIRKTGDAWCLVDIGSTNGTKLNDMPLTPRAEYPLGDGDCISIGSARLTFQTAKRSSSQRSSVTPSTATSEDLPRLLYLLRRAYTGESRSSSKSTPGEIGTILQQAMATLDQVKAAELLASLQAHLSCKPAAIASKPSGEPASAPPASWARRPTGEEYPANLSELVSHFCGELDAPLSNKELEHLVRRLIGILETVCMGLADAVKGRREFQKEFEVEATRIFSWKPNPIKQAESVEEIGAMLLMPARRGLNDDQVADGLKEVFQDLTLHQLGLLAGFRECIRGLLKELDPKILTKPEKGGEKKGIPLLGGGSVRQEAAAWRRFVEKHRQLTEEEVKVFERILAPHFAKGYLSVHKTRRQH